MHFMWICTNLKSDKNLFKILIHIIITNTIYTIVKWIPLHKLKYSFI